MSEDPSLGAADPRHADLPLRRAGFDRLLVDRRYQPWRVDAGSAARPPDSQRCAGLRRRQRGVSQRDDRAGRCRPTGCAVGRARGTYTNVDRTVHLSDQAVDPPGETRSDLRIWVDYARRMGFKGRSGRPIPRWIEPEDAFEGWRKRRKVGRATTAACLTKASVGRAGSSGRATSRTLKASSGSTPIRSSRPQRITASPSEKTCSWAPPRPSTNTGR